MKRFHLLILAAALLVAGLMVPLPRAGRVMIPLGDLLHGPAFAVVGFLAIRFVVRRWPGKAAARAACVWLAVSGFGLLMEVVQELVGRQSSGSDAMANALGAAAGVISGMATTRAVGRRRLGLALLAVLCLSAAALPPAGRLYDLWSQRWYLPLLSSFESWLDVQRWVANDSRMRPVDSLATEGRRSLCFDLDGRHYPGVSMIWGWRDWSQYDRLLLDLRLDAGSPLSVVIKIEDDFSYHQIGNRFTRSYRLTPGRWQTISIDLQEVIDAPQHRQMQLDKIAYLQIFAPSPAPGRSVCVDHVRLE